MYKIPKSKNTEPIKVKNTKDSPAYCFFFRPLPRSCINKYIGIKEHSKKKKKKNILDVEKVKTRDNSIIKNKNKTNFVLCAFKSFLNLTL